ncbi:MAG: hypothetical protein WC960_03975 [Bacteroidales bacterium]
MLKGKIEEESTVIRSKMTGVTLTLLSHLLLLLLLVNSGFKVVYPPPVESGIEVELEFEEEEPKPIEKSPHQQLRSPTPQQELPEQLAKRSESPLEAEAINRGVESTMGDHGDIEKYEPPRKKEIDRRALFPSPSQQDSLSAHYSQKSSDSIRTGMSEGSLKEGPIKNEPTANLTGRSVVGSLPNPRYGVNKSGKVVVEIAVDQYGRVTEAIAGVKGSTVQDKSLWEAAREAALKAKFNMSDSAPPIQKGSITYIFILK